MLESLSIGPTSLDLPAWIQAGASVVSLLAVGAVAWIEHSRVQGDRKTLLKEELDLLRASDQLTLNCMDRLGKIYRAVMHENDTHDPASVRYLNAYFTLAAEVIERALNGRTFGVGTLMSCTQCLTTIRERPFPQDDPGEDEAKRQAYKSAMYGCMMRLASARSRVSARLVELGQAAIVAPHPSTFVGTEALAFMQRREEGFAWSAEGADTKAW